MRVLKSKNLASLVLIPVMALSLLFTSDVTVSADSVNYGERISGVDYRSQDEIKAFLKNNQTRKSDLSGKTIKYAVNPDLSKYTKVGVLSQETQNDFINLVNSIRYIAGLNYDVVWDDSYANLASAASLVNYANKTLSHTPTKPAGFPDSIFQEGSGGDIKSNIAMGYSNVWSVLINAWMNDGDSGNINRCGHRRWILSPALGKTGLGFAGNYSAMYVVDYSGSGSQTGIAWPAQNMPVEFFNANYPWTYSSGVSESTSGVSVSVKSKSSGKTWNFSQIGNTSAGYFNIENTEYGARGCVIFRPAGISVADGQSYDVTISGLQGGTVEYTVNFFGTQVQDYYTVTFDSAGGSLVASQKVSPGKSISLSSPQRTNYLFEGWFTSPTGGTKVSSSYTPTGNVTLYAHWKSDEPQDSSEKNPQDLSGQNLAIEAAKTSLEKNFSVRLYNTKSGDHVYTASFAEAQDLIKSGWNHETYENGKNTFKSNLTKTDEYSKEVYCVFNPNHGGFHLYTFSKGEADSLVKKGWIDIYNGKPVFYVSNDSKKNGIYRAYNPNSRSGQQHYCTKGEYDQLIKKGWRPNNESKPYWYTD